MVASAMHLGFLEYVCNIIAVRFCLSAAISPCRLRRNILAAKRPPTTLTLAALWL